MGCGSSSARRRGSDEPLHDYDAVNFGLPWGRGAAVQLSPVGGKEAASLRGDGDAAAEEAATTTDEELSDITNSISTRSSEGGGGGAPGGPFPFKSDDLERKRNEVPPSIEEDLFVYDDVVVSKNEAQTRHWRIEGRRPQTSRRASRKPNDGAASDNLFHFTDFNVCVDEVDMTVDQPTGSLAMQQLAFGNRAQQAVLLGATVMKTFSTAPNTVVAMLRANEEKSAKTSCRPLRGVKVETLIGHAFRVRCLSVSPVERSLVSCSNEDASVTLRSLVTGEEEGIFTGHRDNVIAAAISPDGKYLATTSKDFTMALWDANTGKLLYVLQHEMVVICCCFAPDSKTVVSGCQDRVCRVWDTRTARERVKYTHHAGIIVSVAYSPDGACVCSTSADRTLQVWSATSGKMKLTMRGHTGIILACSYTSDGKYIVSNDEVHLCVWIAASGLCKLRLAVTKVAGVPRAAARAGKLRWTFSSAAPGAFTQYIIVACTNRYVYILDVDGHEHYSEFCKAPVYCLAVGYKEKAVFGDSFGNVYVMTLS
ncbi:protein kinase [Trypanosoma conorhini]|uniref:Protein kinase n=1 Tax=Trypanosoma conorhini TaxID=83891 RepID=A0A422PPA0_9TRYP|nr:protein kinase [Trypanosoma conorhini]RNF19554.1 protein kinase [Trypanosoma conorhini]